MFEKIMSRVRKLVRNKISNKLIIVSSLFFITSVTLVSGFNFLFTSKQLRNGYIQHNTRILSIICEDFEDYIDQINRQTLAIRNDEDLIDSLVSGDYSYKVENKLKLVHPSLMESLGISEVEFFIPKTQKVFSLKNYSIKTSSADYSSKPWFSKTVESREHKYIEPRLKKNEVLSSVQPKEFAVFRRSIIDFKTGDNAAVIVNMHVGMSVVNKFVSLAGVKEGEILFIYDSDGVNYFANGLLNNKAVVDDGIISYFADPANVDGEPVIRFGNEDYVKVAGKSSDGKWRMVKIVPLKVINSEVKTVFSFALAVILSFIIIATVAIIIITKKMTSSISRLLKYMDYVAAGNLDVQISRITDDEIGQLTRRFNFMTQKVNELLNEKYKLKLSEQNAVMKALEARVNPHFLYNTLQAISSKALVNKQYEICQMLEALAVTFRYCLSKHHIVTIYEELKNIKQYVKLCKIRFGARLEVEYQISEDVMDFRIPRMLLQVLIENSIKYAVETTNTKITIRINIRNTENMVYIGVCDDGPGVDRQRLLEIMEGLKEETCFDSGDHGTGLSNLYARLKIIFGNSSEFNVESACGKGFEVHIRLPRENL